MDVSVTELGLWRRCRRQWDLTSYNRRKLHRRDSVPSQFAIGTAIHLAFAAHAHGLNPISVVDEWLQTRNNVGPNVEEQSELIISLIEHYYSYWGYENPLAPQGLRYLAAEVPLKAPIAHTFPNGHLVGTIDGIAQADDGRIWIIEHKTYAQRPNRLTLDTNEQMTAYMWLFEQVFGFLPAGVLYDGIAKKLPTEPQLLKNGTLSKAWIDTTEACYRLALHNHQLSIEDYADFLTRLSERDKQDQNPFFTRWFIHIPQGSVRNFGEYLYSQYCEMSELNSLLPTTIPIKETANIFYPNFRWEGCWDCSVSDLCKTIQFGEDVDYVTSNFYVEGSGHETHLATKIEAKDVTPTNDFFTIMANHSPNVLIQGGWSS